VGLVKALLKPIVQPLLRVGSLDLLSCRWRLKQLNAAYAELSAVATVHDAPGSPSQRLLDLLPRLAERAGRAGLSLLASRGAPAQVDCWPGEHYRLLAALVQEIQPHRVVEIGTQTGLSALAMLPLLPDGGQLVTFDVVPWNRLTPVYLRSDDFRAGRFEQVLADLGDPATARQHADLLRAADFIFVDGPKDGVFERRLLANFEVNGLREGALLLFDDVRVWNMIDIWRSIAHPKIDLTSLGHYSGSALVQ
jgi:predicted O-methyltransferase YrrM